MEWIITLSAIFTIFTAIAALDLLPTWMFINSLSLIAHTTMIKVNVPGNVNHLFMKFINLFKFNWWEVNEKAADRFSDLKLQEKDLNFLEGMLTFTGYMHAFSINLVIMVAIAIFLLGIWQFCAIKDCLFSWTRSWIFRPLRARHEPIVTNFTLRFVYELFLEMCICICISFMFADTSSFGVELQWVIAIVLAVVIVILIFGLISFCCCNGPYHSGFYLTGRALSSCFGPPAYNDDIRDFAELQRMSRHSRLGNWNDFTPL